eukprot:TRINITY_DN1380_c0_g1_i1.p2 TRINITY_DN1380_c0_g1~~TRINITY_DN1380_c0_g1_i1.p2  ORF type:complete len:134 (-),score=25.95 TRINITY_DN1380_c0_g1_i1:277-678(-)
MESKGERKARKEVYGFVLWILTWIFLILYLIWMLSPDWVFHSIGIYYYPDRYWGVAIPIWVGMAAIFYVTFVFLVNMIITADFDSIDLIEDAFYDKDDRFMDLNDVEIPAIRDVDLVSMNEYLYRYRGEGKFV